MSDASLASPRMRAAESISSLWWLMLLRGILLAILGVYALARPGMTLVTFTQVLGVFVLLDGIFAVVAGALGWAESRGWTIARGVLGILVGLFVFAHPVIVGAIAATIVLLIVAIQAIVVGVLDIVVAIRERERIEGEGWLMLGGALSIIFGAILLTAPFASSLILIRVLGAFAIVFGIEMIVGSFRVRKFGKALAASE
jgi:uncharacterized membrane protein HdeD (DUF308 family)